MIKNKLLKLIYWVRARHEVRYYLNRTLWETGYPWTKLSPRALKEIFPEIGYSTNQFHLVNPFTRRRGTSLEIGELISLLSIVTHLSARKIIEVGTFDGNTTLNLACNIGEQGTVVTLDLPPDGLENENQSGRCKPTSFKRCQFVGHPVENRIQQVYGDSAEIDWSTLCGPFDLAFIDGDHTSRYVRSDTANALRHLRPGGSIVWHDYNMESIASVLDKAVDRGDDVHWIKGTRLAVATFAHPADSAKNFDA